MEDALLVIMSIVGLFAIYWALSGQWKHNRMMKEAEDRYAETQKNNVQKEQESNQQGKDEKKEKAKPDTKRGEI